VFAYDKNRQQASDFARDLEAKLGLPITATDDLADCIRRSDVCITCTTSRKPFISESEICPGIFIAAVGADNPHKQEIDPALMARSKVVCDVIEQCATMGDLHHALSAATMRIERVHAELGEVVAGRKPGRQLAEEVIVFDSTGMALQDVAASAVVYERAIREDAGTLLRLAG
jgi:ornithine cyclodeaminase/alanine dehydrogenase